MMLSFLNIASGSKGNATLIYSETTLFLVDMGISFSELKKGLDLLGKKENEIEAVFITHDHSDHIKGIPLLDENLPLISDKGNYPRLDYISEPFKTFTLGDIDITPLKTSHDATSPIGFLFENNGESLLYMTDTGYIPSKTQSYMRDATYYVIESNYDSEMLYNSSRPDTLKHRIDSRKGHLSNDQSSRYMAKLIGDSTKAIYLAHLSEECNTPEKALLAHQKALEKAGRGDIDVITLWQRKMTFGGDQK